MALERARLQRAGPQATRSVNAGKHEGGKEAASTGKSASVAQLQQDVMSETGKPSADAFAPSFLRAFFTDTLHNTGNSAQALRITGITVTDAKTP